MLEDHLGVKGAERKVDFGRRAERGGSPDDADEVRRQLGSRKACAMQGDGGLLWRTGPRGEGRRSGKPPDVDHPPGNSIQGEGDRTQTLDHYESPRRDADGRQPRRRYRGARQKISAPAHRGEVQPTCHYRTSLLSFDFSATDQGRSSVARFG